MGLAVGGGGGSAGGTTKAVTRLAVVDPHLVIMMRDVMDASETAARLQVGGGAGGGGGGAGEDRSSATSGTGGINGVDGVDGINTDVDIRDYSGSECPDGGIEINVGLDDDGDGSLSSSEVDNTKYVCDGQDGSDGSDGTDGTDGIDGSGDNVTVLMVSLTENEFGFVDDDGDGTGYLGVTVTNDVITSEVVNNGTITVEKLIDSSYYQLQ